MIFLLSAFVKKSAVIYFSLYVSPSVSVSEDLMSFDDLSSTSEKLSHPTANRPKMAGKRLPAQFGGGHSVSTQTYQHATEDTTLHTDLQNHTC